MKKIFLSVFFVWAFGFYAVYQRIGTPAVLVVQPNQQTQNPNSSSNTPSEPPAKLSPPTPQPPAPSPTHTPTSTPIPPAAPLSSPVLKSVYKSGTFAGDIVDAYYGNVQVSVTINKDKITDVQFLDYPQDRRNSIAINSYATPLLREEAIQTQSANVDSVSGATATSYAFIQSLQSAINKSKNT